MGRALNPPHRIFTGVEGGTLGLEGPKCAIHEMTETRLVEGMRIFEQYGLNTGKK